MSKDGPLNEHWEDIYNLGEIEEKQMKVGRKKSPKSKGYTPPPGNLKSPSVILQEQRAGIGKKEPTSEDDQSESELNKAHLKLETAMQLGLLKKDSIFPLSDLAQIAGLNEDKTLQILRSWDEKDATVVYFEIKDVDIKSNDKTKPRFVLLENDEKTLSKDKVLALFNEIRQNFTSGTFTQNQVRDFIERQKMDPQGVIRKWAGFGLIRKKRRGEFEIISTAQAQPTETENK